MRRFLVKTPPERDNIEGVVFYDGVVVLHGDVFFGATAQSIEAIQRMFPHAEIEWIDQEEKGQA